MPAQKHMLTHSHVHTHTQSHAKTHSCVHTLMRPHTVIHSHVIHQHKPRHTHKSFSTDTNLLRNVTLYTNTYTNQQAICIYTKIPVIMVCARTRYWYLIWMIGTDPPSPHLQHIHNTAIRQYTTLQESRKNDSVGEQEARSDNKSLWREYTQWVSMGDSL
jgi:hypothetical protein